MKLGLLAGAALAAALACRAPKPVPAPATALLDEILASHDDNDPRLDSAFNALSAADKAAFREKYRALPREQRNQRGTVVYLLGKNLSTPEDWAFMAAVAGEPPCLSLADCAKPSATAPELGDAVTLAYPSLVALKQAERALKEGRDEKDARAVVAAGRASGMRAVSRLAGRIAAELPGK
jgi:hypothetical protein